MEVQLEQTLDGKLVAGAGARDQLESSIRDGRTERQPRRLCDPAASAVMAGETHLTEDALRSGRRPIVPALSGLRTRLRFQICSRPRKPDARLFRVPVTSPYRRGWLAARVVQQGAGPVSPDAAKRSG